ncbi:MAG: YpdA family putative bacillithiol disulfide reductase [Acidobacteria bacterium]|nr:YpdA family putative bacillithiol disulfide reductase [Acidobacteriota bacterium]
MDATSDVVVIGAGPAGLAVAIAAEQGGLSCEIVEKGVLVNSIYHFPHGMTFFTTPELLEIGGLPFVTPYEKPTRLEALKYYRRVVDTFGLRVSLGEEVVAVDRDDGAFRITTEPNGSSGPSARGVRRARNLVFATGYYDHPNRLGIPGEDLPHVSHYYDEPHPYYRKRVVVVGGKNSAAIAALELYRAGATVTLVHRRDTLSGSIKYWIRPDIKNRIKEGAIAARFESRVVEITPDHVRIEGSAGREDIEADAVFLLTGYHPAPELLLGLGVRIDDDLLKPDHDPETFETNVPGVYLAGSIVSGRETNRTFIETGRFHGAAIVRAILAKR